MSPRLLSAVALACAGCTKHSSSERAARPWAQAGERRPPPQEIAQESDKNYSPVARTFVRTGRQWHNSQRPEGETF